MTETAPDLHPALPDPPADAGVSKPLVNRAQDSAVRALSPNTQRAYARDWAHFACWCQMRGADPLPPSPRLTGLYLADLISPRGNGAGLSVASIKRRLSGIGWGYAQQGQPLDHKDRHIAAVLDDIRCQHARPPARKEAVLPEDLRAMLATLPHDLRGLRDRAVLLIGFAGGLRRSEIVSLDHGKDTTPDSSAWVDILPDGVVLTLRGKTGWREVEIARGSSDLTCPVHALTQWLRHARIDFGPIFVAVSRNGLTATKDRLGDKHVARLVKQTVHDAGLRPDLPKAERARLYSGHSLRAGLASSVKVDGRQIQTQVGDAPAAMTRRNQRRRDRFRVNLTRALGL